jgi:hypothetical protein
MGLFGLGWSLNLPSISRGTGKRLPRFDDAQDSDDFQLTGFEDLVPLALPSGDPDIEYVGGYRVQRYRPRIEGGFARIEKIHKQGEVAAYWRVMPGDGTTTIYGRSDAARIADPEGAAPCLPLAAGVALRRPRQTAVSTSTRPKIWPTFLRTPQRRCGMRGTPPTRTGTSSASSTATANPYVPGNGTPPYDPPRPANLGYFFQTLFDYGEHGDDLDPAEARPWVARGDPWSDRRAGFDLRSNRLCRRVLFYNRFEELDPGSPDPVWVPVKGLEFGYANANFTHPTSAPVDVEKLIGIAEAGYRPDGAGGLARTALAPMRFSYHPAAIDATVHRSPRSDLPNAPSGLMGEVQAIDLFGDGVPGPVDRSR